MKDMYSFAISQEQHEKIYDKVKNAYSKVFDRLGLADKTFITTASGGSFSKYSHEFQTLSEAGEDTIYLDRNRKIAINKEVLTDEVITDLGLKREELEEVRAIEVGNIFSLGTKFSEPFELKVNDQGGEPRPLIMGCYGIGISRVLGTIAELFSDEYGLVWPESIAPVQVIIDRLGDSKETIKAADELYEKLLSKNIVTIYDDRDVRPGEKFADADLMGIALRIVVSDKTVQAGHFEVKKRTSTDVVMRSLDDILKDLAVT
jgi:prolyl-tRNA synthetase